VLTGLSYLYPFHVTFVAMSCKNKFGITANTKTREMIIVAPEGMLNIYEMNKPGKCTKKCNQNRDQDDMPEISGK
jgi:hypothetical protein